LQTFPVPSVRNWQKIHSFDSSASANLDSSLEKNRRSTDVRCELRLLG
jgi:hypothetical protein